MGLLRSCFARTQTCLQPGKQTKGQLAIDILGDADADGLTLDFVCGDEVYGPPQGTRRRPGTPASQAGRPADPGLIPLTVREVRRLLVAALETFNGGGDRLVW